MGKKESMKISKNKNEKNKKDFKSWLNVLRPKVYITDSSSFKSLVQELTGNGTSSSSPNIISSSPSMEEPQVVENNLIPNNNVGIEDYQVVVVEPPESSTDVTVDIASADDDSSHDQHYLYSSQVLLTTNTADDQDHHRDDDQDQVVCDQIWLDGTSLEDLMANQEDQVDLLAYYGSLESWLSDIDHHPYSFCNNGFLQNQQEVSIYDYELSGLL